MNIGTLVESLPEYEPLLTDARVRVIEGALRSRFPTLGEATFVTFIQPATTMKAKDGLVLPVAPMAVFGVLSPNPKRAGMQVFTHGTSSLADWQSEDRDFRHFVGVRDPAIAIFTQVVRGHLTTLRNIREMN